MTNMSLNKEAIKKSGKDIYSKKHKADPPGELQVIWEQVFPEDAESRIQQAFEMLLGGSLISHFDDTPPEA